MQKLNESELERMFNIESENDHKTYEKYGRFFIHIDEQHQMVCVTDLWKAIDGRASQHPDEWFTDPEENIKHKYEDQGDKRFVHWHGALQYAKWLDKDLGKWVNELAIRRFQGIFDPDLGLKRSISEYAKDFEKQGQSSLCILNRLLLMVGDPIIKETMTRVGITHSAQRGEIRNQIHLGIHGMTSEQYKIKHNVKNPRDHFDVITHTKFQLAEQLTIYELSKYEDSKNKLDGWFNVVKQRIRCISRTVNEIIDGNLDKLMFEKGYEIREEENAEEIIITIKDVSRQAKSFGFMGT